MRERSKESKGKISQPIPISDIRYRRPQPGALRAEDFFSGEYDPVDLAIAVTSGTRKDRLLWRTYLRNRSIDEAEFLQCVFTQWREDLSDGEPANPAAKKAGVSRNAVDRWKTFFKVHFVQSWRAYKRDFRF